MTKSEWSWLPHCSEAVDEAVCGVRYTNTDCSTYDLATYNSTAEATAAGASVTHLGACGLCSTLQALSADFFLKPVLRPFICAYQFTPDMPNFVQDLAVYMNITDMTAGSVPRLWLGSHPQTHNQSLEHAHSCDMCVTCIVTYDPPVMLRHD